MNLVFSTEGCINGNVLAVLLKCNRVSVYLLDSAGKTEVHTSLAVLIHKHLADVRVGRARDLVHHFDDCNLCANRCEITSHFKSDNAAADNDEVLGKLCLVKDLAVGLYEAACESFFKSLNRGNRNRGAGSDNELVSKVLLALCVNHLEAVSSLAADLCLGFDNCNLVSLHCCANAANEGLNYLLFALDNLCVIELRALDGNAETCTLYSVSVVLCAVEKGLCGNASLVKAYASEVCLLEYSGLKSAARSSFCGKVAAGAATDNYYLKLFHT